MLSGDEDLEGANNLCERDGLICLPVFGCLSIIDEDNEVIFLALEVALGGVCFSLDHNGGCLYVGLGWSIRGCVGI